MITAGVLLDRVVEFSAIAAVALAAVVVLRHRSAALRHWILSAAVIAAALTPLLAAIVPAWRVPVAPVSAAADSVERVARGTSPAGPLRSSSAEAVSPTGEPGPAAALLALWAAGAAVNAGVLVAGLLRLRGVRARARRVVDGPWVSAVAEIGNAYGLRREVALFESDRPGSLFTWGAARPRVILPRTARQWGDDRMQVVLRHELAHVQRGDWLWQLCAEFLRAFHWFNPLAWIICRRLRHESERAADDAVLSAGIDGRDYAAHLLELARAATRQRQAWWPAPAIVRPSTLERRVAAMLAHNVNRAPLTRSLRMATLAALVAVAAAVASAQGALASFSGSVLDPSNRTVPGVEVIVTNLASNAAQRVRSDEAGRFEFTGLPEGEYAFEARFPGFMTLKGQVVMSGAHVQQPLQLQVGSVQETIVVVSDGAPVAHTQEGVGEPGRAPATRTRTLSPSACESTPHGGNIRPPMKLVDARPFYPPHLASAGIAGRVVIQGTIAKDGALQDLRVVQSAHDDLKAAALAAVRRWEFTGTMLNCMPIEVAITINIDFRTS